MIISRTPFRISFFGGGTDYPSWYHKHGGSVLAATIDKYCYLTCRYFPPFFDYKYRVVWSEIELCQTVDEIKHPAVRGVIKYLNMDRGIEVHHQGDLPARSGMGSSSSFTVGLLHALYALQGHMPNKHQLAMESIHIEQDILKETVGSQDQVLAAYGGLNHITFLPNGEITVRPVTISLGRLRELNSHLMLFYTGIKRTASKVAESITDNMDNNKRSLRIMKDLVDESISILNSDHDIFEFGELLHEAWQAKRGLSEKVTNSQVDDIYDTARLNGAIGGKLTGAGGGGFMLLFAPSEKHQQIRDALNKLIYVPFEIEFSGSNIIFFDPEDHYADLEKLRAKQVIQSFRELSEIDNKTTTA